MRLFSHSSMSVDAVRLRLPGDNLVGNGQGMSSRFVVGMNSGECGVGSIEL